MSAQNSQRWWADATAPSSDRGVPKITTRIATPNEPPTWRAVWFTALPTAKRSGWREDTAAAPSTGKVSPIPSPPSRVAGSHPVRYSGCGPTRKA